MEQTRLGSIRPPPSVCSKMGQGWVPGTGRSKTIEAESMVAWPDSRSCPDLLTSQTLRSQPDWSLKRFEISDPSKMRVQDRVWVAAFFPAPTDIWVKTRGACSPPTMNNRLLGRSTYRCGWATWWLFPHSQLMAPAPGCSNPEAN